MRSLEVQQGEHFYPTLAGTGALPNVRHLRLMDDGLAEFVTSLPRLEELEMIYARIDTRELFRARLPNLRLLEVRDAISFSLKELAANRSLGRLETLRLRAEIVGPNGDPLIRREGVRALVRSPHLRSLKRLGIQRSDMGDRGVREIVQSGILARLEELDLSCGCITDEGARLLAAAPDYGHLAQLDVSEDWLSEAGARALRRRGLKLLGADDQQPPGDETYYRETYDDDWE